MYTLWVSIILLNVLIITIRVHHLRRKGVTDNATLLKDNINVVSNAFCIAGITGMVLEYIINLFI